MGPRPTTDQAELEGLLVQLLGPDAGPDQLGRLKAAVCEQDAGAARRGREASPTAAASTQRSEMETGTERRSLRTSDSSSTPARRARYL